MTSPGGNEVGRVTVRVSPDTSRFREELRQQLRGELQDLEVPVSPDGQFFAERVREMAERAERENKVEIPVEFDQNNVEKLGRSLQKALTVANMPDFLNEMSRLDIVMRNVVANATRIRQSLERTSKTMVDWTKSALNVKQHFQNIVTTARNIRGHIGLIRFGPVENGIQRASRGLASFGRAGKSALEGIGNLVIGTGKLLGKGLTGAIGLAGKTLSAFGQILPRLVGGGIKALGDSLTDLHKSITGVAKGGGSAAAKMMVAFADAGKAALALGFAIAQLGAISTAVVVAGAAIAAAWGAAATAVAAMPALIALIGIPIGLLLLDFDTLKSKIGELSPAFQQFRKDAAEALAAGIAPALETFANRVLPKVRTNLLGVATTLGQVAQKTAAWAATDEGIKLLNGVFANVDRTIKGMMPGIGDLGNAFLQLASTSSAFDALTGAVNTFGAEFRASVTELITNGTMDRAFKGLQLLLESVGRALVGLVENGIRLFSTAAPGLAKGLDSLTNFFGRFNWERLGKAVGDVFRGLGEALDGVDAATIEKITQGFEQLGNTFKSTEFQTAIDNLIASIPTLLGLLDLLVGGFIGVVNAIARVVQFFQGAGQAFSGLITVIGGVVKGLTGGIQAVKDFATGKPVDWSFLTSDVQPTIDKGLADLALGGGKMGNAITGWTPPTTTAANEWGTGLGDALTTSTQKGLSGLNEYLRANGFEVADTVGESMATAQQGGVDAFAPFPDNIGKIADLLPGVVKEGFSPIPDEAIGIFQQLEPGVRRAFAGLSIVAFEGMGYIRDSVTDGLDEIQNILTTQITSKFSDPFRTAFESAKTSVETEMTSITTAISTAVVDIGSQVQTLNTSVSTIGTSFTELGTQTTALGVKLVALDTNLTTVGTSFQNLSNYLKTLTTSLTAANVSVTTLNTSLTTLNTNLVTLGQNFVTVNTNVTTLNTSLTTLGTNLVNLNTGITGINTILPTLIDLLRQFNTALVTLNTTLKAFTQNLTLLLDAINLLIPAIRDLITALTDLNTAFVTLQETIVSVMETITTTVTEGLVTINTAWAEATTLWIELVSAAMTGVVSAIRQGMADSTAEVDKGVQDMVALLSDAEQQFYDAGAAMGQGLADGLRSKASEVRSAAKELADAAAAATRAAAIVHSPSRVFIRIGQFLGDGLAIGIDNGRARVASAATRLIGVATNLGEELQTAFSPATSASWTDGLVDGANSAVDSLSRVSTGTWETEVSADDFGGISQAVGDALSGWSVQIDSNGVAKLVNKSNTRRVRRR